MTVREFISSTLQEPLKKFNTIVQDAILEIIIERIEELHYDISTLSSVFIANKGRLDILNVIAESWGYNIPSSATLSDQIDIFAHIAYVNKIRGSIWSIEHCRELYGGDLPDYIHVNIPSYNIFRYSISPYSIDHVYQDAYRNRVGVYELFLRNYKGDIREFKRFLYDELVASGSKIYLLNNLTADTRSISIETSLILPEEPYNEIEYSVRVNRNLLRDSDSDLLETDYRDISLEQDTYSGKKVKPESFKDFDGLIPFSEYEIYDTSSILVSTDDTSKLDIVSITDSICGTSNAVRVISTIGNTLKIVFSNIQQGTYHLSYYKRDYLSTIWNIVEDTLSVGSDGIATILIDISRKEDFLLTGFKLETGDTRTSWIDYDNDEPCLTYPDIYLRVFDEDDEYEDTNIEVIKPYSEYLNETSLISVRDTYNDILIYETTVDLNISGFRLIVSRDNVDKEYFYQRLLIGDKIYLELENPNGICSREFIYEIVQENTVLDSYINNSSVRLNHDKDFVYLPIKTSIPDANSYYTRSIIDTRLLNINRYQYLIGDNSTRLPLTDIITLDTVYRNTEDELFIFERVLDVSD